MPCNCAHSSKKSSTTMKSSSTIMTTQSTCSTKQTKSTSSYKPTHKCDCENWLYIPEPYTPGCCDTNSRIGAPIGNVEKATCSCDHIYTYKYHKKH